MMRIRQMKAKKIRMKRNSKSLLPQINKKPNKKNKMYNNCNQIKLNNNKPIQNC